MSNDIDIASQELGKSLAKIMMSEKYNHYNYQQMIMILTNTRNNAVAIIKEHQEAAIRYNEERYKEEYTRGEFQNG